ncbi:MULTISPECIES: VTT domain-containing protein [Janibacter]|uniref:DedA family protein n=1 Tax=Janibacter TaxID=53457 RepID=UPI001CD68016|nr:VTT domain-containing protein [Janibacter melonis]MCB5990722.1 VTT domain-containing protein [Janibacter melonis]
MPVSMPEPTTYRGRVEEMMRDWPVGLAFVVLLVAALVRGSATYAIGRGARSAAARRSGADRPGPTMARAERLVRRVGPPAVSLGFLTVGLQSAINLSAGAMRMPLSRFAPALVVGATLWATVYTTIGFAVIEAALGRGSWWLLGAVVVAVAVVLAGRALRRRAR